MKGILEFTLPEEQEEFDSANKGSSYKGKLQDIDNHLRSKLKYDTMTVSAHKALQDFRDWIRANVDDIWS